MRGLHVGPEDPDRAGIRDLEALVRRATSGEDHLDAPLLERLEALEVVQVRGEARLLATDEQGVLEEQLGALAEVRDGRGGSLGRRAVGGIAAPPVAVVVGTGRSLAAGREGCEEDHEQDAAWARLGDETLSSGD